MKIPAAIKQEVVFIGASVLGAVEAAISSGSTLKVVLQGVIPLVIGAVVRQFVTPTPTKEDPMADLTRLETAVANLESAASAVKGSITPQSAVDPLTSRVEAVTSELTSVDPSPAPAPADPAAPPTA